MTISFSTDIDGCVATSSCTTQPVLKLFDSSGNEVTDDDESGEDRDQIGVERDLESADQRGKAVDAERNQREGDEEAERGEVQLRVGVRAIPLRLC